jgi:hypothetical protein
MPRSSSNLPRQTAPGAQALTITCPLAQWDYRRVNLNDVPDMGDDLGLLNELGKGGRELSATHRQPCLPEAADRTGEEAAHEGPCRCRANARDSWVTTGPAGYRWQHHAEGVKSPNGWV